MTTTAKNVITGTAVALLAQGLRLNGVEVKAPYLSVLAGYKNLGVKVTGKVESEVKKQGKPAHIYALTSRKGINEFTLDNPSVEA